MACAQESTQGQSGPGGFLLRRKIAKQVYERLIGCARPLCEAGQLAPKVRFAQLRIRIHLSS
jgi:hypothetical protein